MTPDEPPAALVAEWVAYGILAAAARFIPVPLLDDVARERATRLAVVRTLRANGRQDPAEAVEPLYAGVRGWVAELGRGALAVPGKVVLFPVRKYVTVFGAVRGVPRDVMNVILLARCVHRSLAAGRLRGDGPALRRQAAQVRRAYDGAMSRMDLHLLTAAVQDALSQGRSLSAAALDQARSLLRRDVGDPRRAPAVTAGAQRVSQVLRRPELVQLLERFDAEFDQRLVGSLD